MTVQHTFRKLYERATNDYRPTPGDSFYSLASAILIELAPRFEAGRLVEDIDASALEGRHGGRRFRVAVRETGFELHLLSGGHGSCFSLRVEQRRLLRWLGARGGLPLATRAMSRRLLATAADEHTEAARTYLADPAVRLAIEGLDWREVHWFELESDWGLALFAVPRNTWDLDQAWFEDLLDSMQTLTPL